MKKYLLLAVFFASCQKQVDSSHLISLQMIDRNGQTETISQEARIKLLEKQDFDKPQPYEKILRVFSKNEVGKNPSILTTYHKNGQLFQKLNALDGRAYGEYEEFYESGQIRIKSRVIEGTADLTSLAQSSWVFDGACEIFYPSGKKQAEFNYELGKRTGSARYFFEDGSLQKTLSFTEDLANGELIEYFPSGQILQKTFYQNGKQEGISTAYHANTQIAFTENWSDDCLLTGEYFDISGNLVSSIKKGEGHKTLFDENKIASRIQIQNGKIQGKIETFKNGKLKHYYHVLNDQKEGEEGLYYEDTTVLKMLVNWHQDAITGIVKTFYKDGSLESQKSFNINKKAGPSSTFYKSGDLMCFEIYSQDKLIEGKYYKKAEKIPASTVEDGNGIATFFDEWGAVLQQINYEKGKIVLQDD